MARCLVLALILLVSGAMAADREAILNYQMEGVTLNMTTTALVGILKRRGYMISNQSAEEADEQWWIYVKSTQFGLDRIYIESVQDRPHRLLLQLDYGSGGFDVEGARKALTAALGQPKRCRDMAPRLRCTWQDAPADAWTVQLDIDVYPDRANYLFKYRRDTFRQ